MDCHEQSLNNVLVPWWNEATYYQKYGAILPQTSLGPSVSSDGSRVLAYAQLEITTIQEGNLL